MGVCVRVLAGTDHGLQAQCEAVGWDVAGDCVPWRGSPLQLSAEQTHWGAEGGGLFHR